MKKNENLNQNEMIEALTQYYEAAGFKDFDAKELQNKSEEEIREMYLDMMKEE